MEEFYMVDGSVLRIEKDTGPDSPREWDNLGAMICWHTRYNLGDIQGDVRPSQWAPPKGAEMLPLYLYDHSGITMRTFPFHCPWDSGQVGWIYATLSDCRDAGHNWKRWTSRRRALVRKWLEGEVQTYDQYLTGDIYGFTLEDPDGEHIDSCWGFYGDNPATNGMLEHWPENVQREWLAAH